MSDLAQKHMLQVAAVMFDELQTLYQNLTGCCLSRQALGFLGHRSSRCEETLVHESLCMLAVI